MAGYKIERIPTVTQLGRDKPIISPRLTRDFLGHLPLVIIIAYVAWALLPKQ